MVHRPEEDYGSGREKREELIDRFAVYRGSSGKESCIEAEEIEKLQDFTDEPGYEVADESELHHHRDGGDDLHTVGEDGRVGDFPHLVAGKLELILVLLDAEDGNGKAQENADAGVEEIAFVQPDLQQQRRGQHGAEGDGRGHEQDDALGEFVEPVQLAPVALAEGDRDLGAEGVGDEVEQAAAHGINGARDAVDHNSRGPEDALHQQCRNLIGEDVR